jgi:iron complex outermembrane receptor protein
MKSFRFFTLIYLGLIAGFFFASPSFAQTTQKISLLDQENALPIRGATFQYGEQTGVSSEKGIISFVLEANTVMQLSHINYGSWEWNEQELKAIAQEGVYYRQSIAVNLYPVTIIALRPNLNPDERINIDYQDRMQHDASAILSQIPAINVIQKGGNYGFDPVLRGFKYDQLNIVMNGAQSATAACPNRMDPPTSQMAPNMMDRIEVLKGPHALRFGTGFGGTINFIPTKLRFTPDPDLYGRLSSEYQSNGQIFRSEGKLGFSGQNYDLSLLGAWAQGNDYLTGDGETVQADFQRGNFGANLGLKLSPKQQLRISALYNLARETDFPALPMDLREDDTWMFNARHDIAFNGGNLQSWNTTVFGSFVTHLMDNLLKPLDPRMLNAETLAKTYNYGGRTEGFWRFAKGKLYTGADLRVEGAEGTRVREFLMGPNAGKVFEDNAWQDGRISKAGLFGEYHFHQASWHLIASTRLELNQAVINDPSSEFVEVYSETQVTQFNPSFSLGLQKSLSPKVKAGLWLGRAQRSGSLTERFINYFPVGLDPYEMLGNPELRPEVNNQIDLTFSWATEKTALNIDLFAAYLQDYISSIIDPNLKPRLPMSPGVRQFTNIEQALKTGFEVSWTQELFLGLQHQTGVAYTYAQDLERDEPLPEIAPLDFRYTLRGQYLKGKLQPEATFRYVMAQSRISKEFGETETPAFALLNVKLGYQLAKMIRVQAGVNNLLDENYYEHLTRSVRGTPNPIYAPGRNFYGSLNLTF